MQVNILEAKNSLSRLIKVVQSGEEVVIANRGEPVARLVPVGDVSATGSRRGNGAAILAWLDAHPLPSYARRTAEEIDATIEEERQAWG